MPSNQFLEAQNGSKSSPGGPNGSKMVVMSAWKVQIVEKVALERKSDGGRPRAEGGSSSKPTFPQKMRPTRPDTGAFFLRRPSQKCCNVGLEGANPRKGPFREEIVKWGV